MKDKDLKEIQALIHVGKQRGYVTYEEMNTLLPTHLISADEMDNVMIMFSELDIEVVTENRVAFELYKKMGFVVVGEQPRAIKVNGKYFDEHLLVRHLDLEGR